MDLNLSKRISFEFVGSIIAQINIAISYLKKIQHL